MAYDGSGNFLRVMNWTSDAAANIKILASRHDTEDNNLASGLSNAICKDGQTQPTADIPLNGHKLTNVGAPVNPTDAATKGYADSIRSFSTGIAITGSGAVNGSITHSGTTGPWGNAFTAADLYFGVRAIGDPTVETTNARFIWNDKADATGTDMMDLNDAVNPVLRLRSIDAGAAAGPIFRLYRNSASPAAGDALGEIEFWGKDSSGADMLYGTIRGLINDPVNNSEDGSLYFLVPKDGVDTSVLALNGTACSFGVPLSISPSLSVTGPIQSTGNQIAVSGSPVGHVTYNTGTGLAFGMYSASNSQLYFSQSTAAGVPTGALMMQCDVGGNFSTNGSVTAGTNLSVWADNSQYFGRIGAVRYLSWSSGAWFQYDTGTGTLAYTANSIQRFFSRISDGGFINLGPAFKPGGGPWSDSSDARIKNVQGDYTTGLDAIKGLHPVRFTYKGNDTPDAPANAPKQPSADDTEIDTDIAEEPPIVPYPNSNHYQVALAGTEFVGMIAQEVEQVMPGMVSQVAGYIDGEAVTDLRNLDTTNLVFALINAVKELSAKVEALEAK